MVVMEAVGAMVGVVDIGSITVELCIIIDSYSKCGRHNCCTIVSLYVG